MPRVIHFNLPVDDVERAMSFYGKVFGWTFQKLGGPVPYFIATTGPDDQPGINGTIYARENGQPAGMCNVISVASIDEAVGSIEKAGGTVSVRKMPIPGVGWIAVAADTEETVFTLLQADHSVG